MTLKCSRCGNEYKADDFYVCSDCGNFLCKNCAENSNAVCPGCYGRLNRLC